RGSGVEVADQLRVRVLGQCVPTGLDPQVRPPRRAWTRGPQDVPHDPTTDDGHRPRGTLGAEDRVDLCGGDVRSLEALVEQRLDAAVPGMAGGEQAGGVTEVLLG